MKPLGFGTLLELDALQGTIAAHHKTQFGDPHLAVRGMKLGEEAGEVMAALVRHLQGRDGRSWLPEVESELGDVMTVLLSLCEHLGLSLADITNEATKKFLVRTWNHGEKA